MPIRALLLAAVTVFGVGCSDDEAEPEPRAKAESKPAPEKKDDDGEARRARSLARLAALELIPPKTLPTSAKRPGVAGTLRPLHEVAGRAMALKALYAWSAMDEAEVPAATITEYVKRSGLKRYLNPTEVGILAKQRGAARLGHRDEAQWRLENLWALCWILGADPEPPLTGGLMTQAQRDALLGSFLPGWDGDLKGFVGTAQSVRETTAVVELEDAYYCAHAAARASSMGQGVPATFDPTIDGGAIHERRHALSWSLSPGVPWDQTDLTN